MTRYISDTLRERVEERAKNLCEYCLIPIEATYFGGEIDHIVSLKHDGAHKLCLINLTELFNPAGRINMRL
jgi:5-methylcytosine-specific restriction endonuclease McrA